MDDMNPRLEILAGFTPSFTDFTADLEGFFAYACDWGRENAERLKAADVARGYGDDAIGVIERDLFGVNLFWLQKEYFARGLHDLVADHFIARPLWDREYRALPWTDETGSPKRVASSDGIPLEELREAFARFAYDGRADLSAQIWLHITHTTLSRDGDPIDKIETFDLCKAVVDLHGSDADRAQLHALAQKLPT